MVYDFLDCKSCVEAVLKINIPARDDDRELFKGVWKLQGIEFPITEHDFFCKAFSTESIRRRRQEFQSKGMYTGSNRDLRVRTSQIIMNFLGYIHGT